MSKSRVVLGALALVNAIVLLGRVWPAGAPPFARWVDLAFLVASLAYFVAALARGGAGAAR